MADSQDTASEGAEGTAEGGWVVTGETDGEMEMELRPPPQFIDPEDVSLDVLQRGCQLIGIDPDRVLAGKDVELPENVPLMTAEPFLDLVVENFDEYDLRGMQAARARAFIGVALTHFIRASVAR